MPRGDHLRKVTEEQIVSAFQYDDFGRSLLSPEEVAELLNRYELEEEEITGEAVRQRMHKIPQLETYELGGATLWKKKDDDVFAGGVVTREMLPSVMGYGGFGLVGIVTGLVLAFAAALYYGEPLSLDMLGLAAIIGGLWLPVSVYLASALIAVYQGGGKLLKSYLPWGDSP